MSKQTNLEEENERLRARVDMLEQQLLARGIRPPGWHASNEPSDQEYDALIRVVTERWPVLAFAPRTGPTHPSADQQRAEFRADVIGAFRYLMQARRSEKLATSHFHTAWTDEAGRHASRRIGLQAFCIASIAVGDLVHSIGERWPHDCNFALSSGGRDSPYDPEGFRKVLRGEFVEPVQIRLPSGEVPRAMLQRGGQLSNYLND